MLNRLKNVTARQRGLSIVELMVALAISSFLILGITQLYINNSGSSKTGNALGCNFAAGASVIGDASSICIRYQARDAGETDCRGQVLSAQSATLATNADAPYKYSNASQNAVIVARFSLAADANFTTGAADESPRALVCASNLLACGNGSCTRIKGDTDTAQLISGIRDLRFDYGVGVDRSVSSFTPTPSVSAANLIRAVRYSALLQSVAQGLRDTSDTPPVLGQWNKLYSTTFTGNAYLYQIAQDTITLRNLMP